MNDLLKPFVVQPEKELDLYITGIGLPRYRNDNDALRQRRDFGEIGPRCVPVFSL